MWKYIASCKSCNGFVKRHEEREIEDYIKEVEKIFFLLPWLYGAAYIEYLKV